MLYLDAANNPAHPDAWTNLGTAGGELSGLDTPPVLEEGAIEIPSLGIAVPDAKFYTHMESGQAFGGPDDGIQLSYDDFTVEMLLRRNGDLLAEEHHIAGFVHEGGETNWTRLSLWWGPDEFGEGAVNFDKSVPVTEIVIGGNTYGERHRTFNGSVAWYVSMT